GVFVPPGMLTLGYFLEDLALQIPLALVFLVLAVLGALALISVRPNWLAQEATDCSAPIGWLACALLALALMGVPLVTWAASHWMYPPPYMLRYMFPCIVAWAIIIALALLAVHRLPRPSSTLWAGLHPGIANSTWAGLLIFCILFQPMRAWKNPARPGAPFV